MKNAGCHFPRQPAFSFFIHSVRANRGHRGSRPCQAGFAQSNPLLVRPIPHNFALKRTQSTDGRFDLHSRFCLVINQFGFNDFSGAVLNTFHTAYPFHLVGGFERFGHTFLLRHSRNDDFHSFIAGLVNLGKVPM